MTHLSTNIRPEKLYVNVPIRIRTQTKLRFDTLCLQVGVDAITSAILFYRAKSTFSYDALKTSTWLRVAIDRHMIKYLK